MSDKVALARRAVLLGGLATVGLALTGCRRIVRAARTGDGGGGGPAPAVVGVYDKKTMPSSRGQRTYYLHVPKQYQPGGPALPLVVLLHGHGASGAMMADNPGAQALADSGMMVAAPTAIDGDWVNADVEFIDQLFAALVDEYGIKPKGWVIGFSDGGGLALACGAFGTRCRGIGTMGITSPRDAQADTTGATLPFTVQIIGIEDQNYGGSDMCIPWQAGRDAIAAAVGATGDPKGPTVVRAPNGMTAETFEWPGKYVWIRVTGRTATHRIYTPEKGDPIDGIATIIRWFRDEAGLEPVRGGG